MKKFLSVIVLVALAFPAFALMDTKDFTATVVGTGTGTQSIVIRGSLEGVYVTVPSGGTATVTIATSEQTLFTKSCTSSAFYPILVPAYGSTGAALTQSAYGSTYAVTTNSNTILTPSTAYALVAYTTTAVNVSGEVTTTNTYVGYYMNPTETTKTNTVTTYNLVPTDTATANVVYTKPAMAGTVTATFVGANGASVTNAWAATVVFDR